jgi:hypothetical protein
MMQIKYFIYFDFKHILNLCLQLSYSVDEMLAFHISIYINYYPSLCNTSDEHET